MSTDALVRDLKGVGPKLEARLARLGIYRLVDLLLHLPLRYQDRTRVTPLGALRPGMEALIEGEVVLTGLRHGKRTMLLCRLQDGSGSITLRFFHFSTRQWYDLERGARLRCYGEVRGNAGELEIIHPEYQSVEADTEAPPPRLTPVYPSTEGLHQATLRGLVEQALQQPMPADHLPALISQRLGLPELEGALRLIHHPRPECAVELLAARHPAQRRLAFEELLAHQLSLRALRRQTQSQPAPVLPASGLLRERFLATLPFSLTAAQRRVSAQIDTDLGQARPMLRLVQGDVGSGKTVVAVLAMLTAVEAGKQAALMAPTELLSEQHYGTLRDWLAPLGLRVVWLTGRLKNKARAEALEHIRAGTGQIVVGTHALFQEAVEFSDLALVIVDEQHRFGVHQRLALRTKGSRGERRPHQLIMTATPIPRTLAMSAYADLDTSVIDDLPPGRTPVITVAVPDTRRGEVMDRIKAACRQGRQAYWVCTLIEESDQLQAQAAEEVTAQLKKTLPGLRIGLVHGRLKGEDKEHIMAAFKTGEIDLLVATTVIEVGVDVPKASLMIIENSERLGLAQLHQLRGRVGRGRQESHCVLLYRPPLSEPAHIRLATLRASNDGFVIAERDLELRGPGEVLGTRQTGDLQFRIADLRRDEALLPEVQAVADELLSDYPANAEAIVQRWIGRERELGAV